MDRTKRAIDEEEDVVSMLREYARRPLCKTSSFSDLKTTFKQIKNLLMDTARKTRMVREVTDMERQDAIISDVLEDILLLVVDEDRMNEIHDNVDDYDERFGNLASFLESTEADPLLGAPLGMEEDEGMIECAEAHREDMFNGCCAMLYASKHADLENIYEPFPMPQDFLERMEKPKKAKRGEWYTDDNPCYDEDVGLPDDCVDE